MMKKIVLRLLLGMGVGAVGYLFLYRLGYIMPISQMPEVLCGSRCTAQSYHQVSATLPVDHQEAVGKLLNDDELNTKDVSLYVEKAASRLTLFHLGKAVKSYDIVLGTNPEGDKRREGDLKTPEGVFKVRDLYPHDTWSKFIWLDYPTSDSWRKHFAAKFSGQIGLLSTIGSEVGIHGVPEGADQWIADQKNWTWGCVSLTNADVNEIYKVIGRDTVIEIVP